MKPAVVAHKLRPQLHLLGPHGSIRLQREEWRQAVEGWELEVLGIRGHGWQTLRPLAPSMRFMKFIVASLCFEIWIAERLLQD